MTTVPTYCRVCLNFCPIVATVDGGRVVRVEGDRENTVWRGHTCVKGREQHRRMYGPGRLLQSQRRTAHGGFEPIAVERAMDEIAERLRAIVERHGMRSVAYYTGSAMITSVAMNAVAISFFRALGTPMIFTPNTIDKPGKSIAKALHGTWQAPPQGYHDPQVALLVGANPYVSYEGAPIGNPGWLAARMKAGMRLIVIDPRLTDTARRATVHLRARPGEDAAILAAMLRVILDEELGDREFVAAHVAGVAALRRALEPFSPMAVAARAEIEADDLVHAARLYGRAARGYAFAGTGPSMSDPGPLTEYLILCLESLCGHWLRAGERVMNAPALFPTPEYRAQASPPRPARMHEHPIRIRGLSETPAGLPTAALADEILEDGEGQVRALISCGGNPVGAFPDERKVVAAMQKLELLVQIDPVMSQTAQLADYVIAPLMPLETADISQWQDFMGLHHTGFGNVVTHAQYAPAVVSAPRESDLIGEWEFFYGLAQRLGLELEVTESCFGYRGIRPFSLDMETKPAYEELLERLAARSRIPLSEVRQHPHGTTYTEPPVFVQPEEPDWPHRLHVGNTEMLSELRRVAERRPQAVSTTDAYEFRLVCRRAREMFNTWLNDGVTAGGRMHNPAYLHPEDLRRLGVAPGDVVEIASAHVAVHAVADADEHLLPGLVSISHGFGQLDPDGEDRSRDPRAFGTNVSRLLRDDNRFDPYSGMPPMSNIPVRIRPAESEPAAAATNGGRR